MVNVGAQLVSDISEAGRCILECDGFSLLKPEPRRCFRKPDYGLVWVFKYQHPLGKCRNAYFRRSAIWACESPVDLGSFHGGPVSARINVCLMCVVKQQELSRPVIQQAGICGTKIQKSVVIRSTSEKAEERFAPGGK